MRSPPPPQGPPPRQQRGPPGQQGHRQQGADQARGGPQTQVGGPAPEGRDGGGGAGERHRGPAEQRQQQAGPRGPRGTQRGPRRGRAGPLTTGGATDRVGEAATAQGPRDVAVLRGPVQLGAPVLAGDPVVQVARHLAHPEPGPQQVDGERRLHAPARCQRARRLERRRGSGSAARQRLCGDQPAARRSPGAPAPRPARGPRRRCAAAAGPRSPCRPPRPAPAVSGAAAAALSSRSASRNSSGRGQPLARGRRLRARAAAPVSIAAALPRLRVCATTRAPASRAAAVRVARPVVHDDHEVDAGERAAARTVVATRACSSLAGMTTATSGEGSRGGTRRR